MKSDITTTQLDPVRGVRIVTRSGRLDDLLPVVLIAGRTARQESPCGTRSSDRMP